MGPGGRDPEQALSLLRQFGAEAVSFQGLETGMRHWFVEGTAQRAGACVAYVDTGRVWVAAGRPVAEQSRAAEVASAFVDAARTSGKTACFFATEQPLGEGFSSLLLGVQPVWRPAEWPAILAAHRGLREQLRRAAAKGVRVRPVPASELEGTSPLRAQVEALAAEWLGSRHMEPMGFLVALELFQFAAEHRYFVAEQDGRAVAFLSAVPAFASRGWLVEDIVRSRHAPSGTTEALVDAVMRMAAGDDFVTLGLAPLAGPVSGWLRYAAAITRPLYDFRGIYEFKRRLHPSRWQYIWLAYPRSEQPLCHVTASLRAFAGGSLLTFGARSIARHPSGAPWALALPLVPWVLLLLVLLVTGHSAMLGFSRSALGLWIGFDVALVVLLLRTAWRPRPGRLAVSAAAAALDAGWSVPHAVWTGLGKTVGFAAVRCVAALAPCLGAVVLAWATAQALDRSRA